MKMKTSAELTTLMITVRKGWILATRTTKFTSIFPKHQNASPETWGKLKVLKSSLFLWALLNKLTSLFLVLFFFWISFRFRFNSCKPKLEYSHKYYIWESHSPSENHSGSKFDIFIHDGLNSKPQSEISKGVQLSLWQKQHATIFVAVLVRGTFFAVRRGTSWFVCRVKIFFSCSAGDSLIIIAVPFACNSLTRLACMSLWSFSFSWQSVKSSIRCLCSEYVAFEWLLKQ